MSFTYLNKRDDECKPNAGRKFSSGKILEPVGIIYLGYCESKVFRRIRQFLNWPRLMIKNAERSFR